ncbi:ATP-binding cassette domain-containing protein [Companilactobacillus crustorum]|uniref:ATP-binding cassette domain-containing protein n=1 Tax=Companilactobacillus crustorum TaxID=392416 RepID=UPI00237EDECD|nr:ATP-binding cassette domain-containing protein [Companilactobacillus crustorum]WDT66660.1 ATP-binding cassette domain-containing protein [Companilactobacillus crustorum]
MQTEIAIKVEHLSKTFTDQKAVDDISFTVKQGEVFGLLGPNGAGKTTILRMITTLLKPTDGKITIWGHNVKTESKLARSTFGLTGQYAAVDEDISARENLLIFSRLNGLSIKMSKLRTDELLKEFSLEKSADKSIKEFSGGMRRRLDLAISLITRPKIIFLDEPTTGLDPRTRTQMWDTIRALVKHGSTIFLTTQYLEEADNLADRVAVIDHGKLIKIGTPKDLKDETGESTLSLDIVNSKDIPHASAILQKELGSEPLLINNSIVIKFKKSEQAITVLSQLNNAKINITNLSVQQPSLDDVFMALTVGKN